MTSPDIDIVDKLRFWQARGERHTSGAAPVDYMTLRQAADEIVGLMRELANEAASSGQVISELRRVYTEQRAEIKRLREENAALRRTASPESTFTDTMSGSPKQPLSNVIDHGP